MLTPNKHGSPDGRMWQAYQWMLRQRFIKESLIVSIGYFLYMFTRKLAFQDVEAIAFDNAQRLISFETSINLFFEVDLQSWLLTNLGNLVRFFNWSYIITFFPVIIPTAIILYKVDVQKYVFYRNIVLLSFAVALMVFALFPLAPPRMITQEGFVDTIQLLGPTQYNDRESQWYYNAFAAMPSLHFGWTIMFGVLYYRTRWSWLMVLGLLYPTTTFFSIVVTGNHYFMDAVGGAGVIGLAFLINAAMVKRNIPLNASLLMLPIRSFLAHRKRMGRSLTANS